MGSAKIWLISSEKNNQVFSDSLYEKTLNMNYSANSKGKYVVISVF